MLPSPQIREHPFVLNGKYAEDAMEMFLQEIKKANTLPHEYQVKVFGGGNMLSNKEIDTSNCSISYNNCIKSFDCKKISCKNTLIAPFLLENNGFKIINRDLGGIQHRKVVFELWSGDVWMKKGVNKI